MSIPEWTARHTQGAQRGQWRQQVLHNSALLRNVLKVLKRVVAPHRHIYFEWPTKCPGWSSPELAAFEKYILKKHVVHHVTIHGCMYGLRSVKKGMKSWTILTTDPTFESACGRHCDGMHGHTRIVGEDTQHSGFYPDAMGRAIAKHWASSSR